LSLNKGSFFSPFLQTLLWKLLILKIEKEIVKMEKLYVVEFIYEGVNNLFLKKIMAKELMKGYKVFADKANSGITDKINSDFKSLYPNYFENNKDKECYDLTEYNQYIADGYNQLICNAMNKNHFSYLLKYFVNPEVDSLMGRLRFNKKATIEFYLKEKR